MEVINACKFFLVPSPAMVLVHPVIDEVPHGIPSPPPLQPLDSDGAGMASDDLSW